MEKRIEDICLLRKSRKTKRNLRRTGYINAVDYRNVIKLLPYG